MTDEKLVCHAKNNSFFLKSDLILLLKDWGELLRKTWNSTFWKVREDVKVNSATHIAMSFCNETNHETYWHFIIIL